MDNNNTEATTEASNNIYYNDYRQDHIGEYYIRVYHTRVYHINFESIKIMISLSFCLCFWISQATKIMSQDEWSIIKKVGVLKIQNK